MLGDMVYYIEKYNLGFVENELNWLYLMEIIMNNNKEKIAKNIAAIQSGNLGYLL